MNTSSHLSSTHSSPSEFGDEASMMEPTNWQRIPPSVQATPSPIGGSSAPSSVPAKAQTLPLQKRRRVTRACDECRRKKIKCDGKQPCTHCTVYSYGSCLFFFEAGCFLPAMFYCPCAGWPLFTAVEEEEEFPFELTFVVSLCK